MFRVISFITCAVICIDLVRGANIFIIIMAGTKSHKIPFKELSTALISRGHSVTLASPFPTDNDLIGVKEIHPSLLVKAADHISEADILGLAMKGSPGLELNEAINFVFDACRALAESNEMKEYVRGETRPDLIIIDSHIGTCPMGLAAHMDVPFIYVNTVSYCLNFLSFAGYPAPEAVNPFYNFAYTNDMTFLQRVHSTLFQRAAYLVHDYIVAQLESMLSEIFMVPSVSIREKSAESRFLFQNTHTAVSQHGPYFKNTVNIGGVHLKEGKDLPKDLKDFINSSKEDVIYFSMGTSVIQSVFPEKLKLIILEVFSRLNYRILWKWSGKEIHNLPKNVLIKKWFPQQDVLAHPKVKLFVTNGGIHSTLETLYHGVPAVFIPVYADQLPLSLRAMHDGYGIKVNLTDISADILYLAIMNVVQTPSYRNAVLRIQRRMKDNMHSSIDSAMFWIDYVLRHKNSSHLKSPHTRYYVYQYYSLDVIAILLFGSLLVIYTFIKLLKILFSKTKIKMFD